MRPGRLVAWVVSALFFLGAIAAAWRWILLRAFLFAVQGAFLFPLTRETLRDRYGIVFPRWSVVAFIFFMMAGTAPLMDGKLVQSAVGLALAVFILPPWREWLKDRYGHTVPWEVVVLVTILGLFVYGSV